MDSSLRYRGELSSSSRIVGASSRVSLVSFLENTVLAAVVSATTKTKFGTTTRRRFARHVVTTMILFNTMFAFRTTLNFVTFNVLQECHFLAFLRVLLVLITGPVLMPRTLMAKTSNFAASMTSHFGIGGIGMDLATATSGMSAPPKILHFLYCPTKHKSVVCGERFCAGKAENVSVLQNGIASSAQALDYRGVPLTIYFCFNVVIHTDITCRALVLAIFGNFFAVVWNFIQHTYSTQGNWAVGWWRRWLCGCTCLENGTNYGFGDRMFFAFVCRGLACFHLLDHSLLLCSAFCWCFLKSRF
jgi:hypothetical protein